MPITDPTGSASLKLSRAEQWVVHHVLLESIGLADGQPENVDGEPHSDDRNRRLLEKIEEGYFQFTPAELSIVKQTCEIHARQTQAGSDENLAKAVASRIDSKND